MVKTRKLQVSSAGNKEKEDDRISMLPDELIHYIMSFIDTKYAVQTSVLSKRWTDIWKSLPFLNFNRFSFPYKNPKMFADFVYMAFLLRDTTNINKFDIVDWENSASDSTSITNLNRWWLNAVKLNVQEITITIVECYTSAYEIHHRLLNCESLTKLDLVVSGKSTIVDIVLPRSMNLPRLKELNLYGLSISNLELSEKLFSSCPVLEKLLIVDNRRSLIVDSLSLKEFEYCCWHRQDNDSTGKINIKLNAPNLNVFSCKSLLTQEYCLEICSPISWVGFDIILSNEKDEAEAYEELPALEKNVYAKRMVKFLGAVSMVKGLTLSSGFLEVLSQAPDLVDCQPPRLCNLQNLTLHIWSTKGCLRAIAYLLNIAPNITALALVLKKSNLADVGDDWEAGLSLPGTFSNLKDVRIKGVEGCDADIKLLTFLLKNAKVLQIIALSFSSSVCSPDKARQVKQFKKFKKKLSSVPSASSSIYWCLLNPVGNLVSFTRSCSKKKSDEKLSDGV